MKKFLFLIFSAVLILSACSQGNEKFVTINNTKIKVEIADTPELQYQGLSNREELCDNCGMLFVFPDKQILTFVMRDMNFPLDIIWIDDNLSAQAGKIVKINKNAIPEGSNPVMRYSSDMPVNYVLEINAGFCDGNGIEVGDSVEFDL